MFFESLVNAIETGGVRRPGALAVCRRYRVASGRGRSPGGLRERLLDAGANVAACASRRRATATHYAADGYINSDGFDAAAQVATLALLVAAGADLAAADAPLHRAVRTRCAQAIRFLLGAGGRPNAPNKSGSTPFHLAVQTTGRGGSGETVAVVAQHDIVAALVAYGASVEMTDGKGRSVREAAQSACIARWLTQ